jgi:hypothetical protein
MIGGEDDLGPVEKLAPIRLRLAEGMNTNRWFFQRLPLAAFID